MTTKGRRVEQRGPSVGQISVVTTSQEYQKLCINSRKRLASPVSVELLAVPMIDKVTKILQQSTLLVSRLADISQATLKRAGVGATTRHLVFLEDLPIEAIAARLLPLNIRNSERIHIAAQRDQASKEGLIFRVFSGMTESSGSHPIVDAWIENKHLVLLSPTFSRLEVPLGKLARLIGTVDLQIAAFEIDEDGRFLYWPHADVHLGWTQFEQIVDPAKIVTATKTTLKYNQRYGAAIRALRESAGLKQSEIQGITERQLRRVEHGQQTASKATLEALAKAHSLPLADYVERLSKRVSQVGQAVPDAG